LAAVGEGNQADVLSQTTWKAIWWLWERETKQTFSPRPPGEPFGGCGRGRPSRRSIPDHLESHLAVVGEESQADIFSQTSWKAIWRLWGWETKQTLSPRPPGEPFCGCGEGKQSRRSPPDHLESHLAAVGERSQADILSQTTRKAIWRLWEKEAKQTFYPRPLGEPFGGCVRGQPSKHSLPDHPESHLEVVGEGSQADAFSQATRRAIWRLWERETKQTFSPRPPGEPFWRLWERETKQTFSPRPPGEPFGGCGGGGESSRRSLPDHLESHLAAVGEGNQAEALSQNTWKAIWRLCEREAKQSFSPRPPGEQFGCRGKGRTSKRSLPNRLGNIWRFLQARDLQAAMVADLWVSALTL
jgi:hypothetical protein